MYADPLSHHQIKKIKKKVGSPLTKLSGSRYSATTMARKHINTRPFQHGNMKIFKQTGKISINLLDKTAD